jgi:hypothetical protein
LLCDIRDRRVRPRIAASVVVRSLLVLFLGRLGSLHALEQTRRSTFWCRWLGSPLPSADTLGRVACLLDPKQLRDIVWQIYTRLKRNKALGATSHGLMALVLDGHESHASYKRHCAGCLERPVNTRWGWRRQYYHRNVTAMLLSRPFPLLLDAEPLRPGEDEIEAARRLLERLLSSYPRAFDVVLGDALYTDPKIYELGLAHGKDILTVLKRNTPDLLEDAQSLFNVSTPRIETSARLERRSWDAGGFTSWLELGRTVRVVRSQETRLVHRQLDRADETLLSQWLWVTTLSPQRAITQAVVQLGHARWEIENRGFNETVNRWHVDHVYRHEATAILCFYLLAMIAYNLFHAFYHRNLKPHRRKDLSYLHLARSLACDLYRKLPAEPLHPP